MITGDSLEYEILALGASQAPEGGLFCEIGVRAGGGIVTMMAHDSHPSTRPAYVGIDPYGNIEYIDTDTVVRRYDYTNEMRDTAYVDLYSFAKEHESKPNLILINLSDTDFFKMYADGVPVYDQERKLHSLYSMVHFDGPHSKDAIIAECEFFRPRMMSESMWCFDDIGNYNHDAVERWLFGHGFEIVKKGGRKALYKLPYPSLPK